MRAERERELWLKMVQVTKSGEPSKAARATSSYQVVWRRLEEKDKGLTEEEKGKWKEKVQEL